MKDIHLSFRGFSPKKLMAFVISGALALGVFGSMPFQVVAETVSNAPAGVARDAQDVISPSDVQTPSDPDKPTPGLVVSCSDAEEAIAQLAKDEVAQVNLRDWPDNTQSNAAIFQAALPKQKSVLFYTIPRDENNSASMWHFSKVTQDVGDVNLGVATKDTANAGALAGFPEGANTCVFDFAQRGNLPGEALVTIWFDSIPEGTYSLYEFNQANGSYTKANKEVQILGYTNDTIQSSIATISVTRGATYVLSDQPPENQPVVKPGEVVTASDAESAIEYLKQENVAGVYLGKDSGVTTENADLFAAAKETGKTLQIDVGNAEWRFDGKTMDEILNVDLNVTVNAENAGALVGFPEGAKTCVLEFAHHGALPGPAEISLYGIDLPAGSYSLYYFNPDTEKYELIQEAVEVSEYHTATIKLTHCSTYVLSDVPVNAQFLAQIEEQINPPAKTGKEAADENPSATHNAKTGEAGAVSGALLLGTLAVGALALKRRKK